MVVGSGASKCILVSSVNFVLVEILLGCGDSGVFWWRQSGGFWWVLVPSGGLS
jgi:hypothetical protein